MMKIYITLILLTLLAFVFGWFKLMSATIVAILLVTTFIKGQLIIDYFMGLKEVQLKYRIIPIVWLFFVLIFIGIAYYM